MTFDQATTAAQVVEEYKDAIRGKTGILNEDGTSNFFLKTIEQGAATALFAAFDPSVIAHNGDLLSDCAPASTSLPIPIPEFFNSPAEADKLWSAAEEAWGVEFAKAE
ncbi:hypothetical protein DL93DRAFT_2098136 [Clavulina sp. PMI_390]|nr:hypothetical protein DL93DRAFT_2098136 [Clavulina sp. PMI_390]